MSGLFRSRCGKRNAIPQQAAENYGTCFRPFEKPHGRLPRRPPFRARRGISMDGFFSTISTSNPLVLRYVKGFRRVFQQAAKLASMVSLKFAALVLVHFIPSKNLPFPSLSNRGENRMETIPPLKKGDRGGFAFGFICRER